MPYIAQHITCSYMHTHLCTHTHSLPCTHICAHTLTHSHVAYDFTGQWSDAHSLGVTVDTTPPTLGSIWLGSETALSLTSVSSGVPMGWYPALDLASGVVELGWSLGSRPGSSDLYHWTGLQPPYTLRASLQDLGLPDGQLVFASLVVRTYMWLHGSLVPAYMCMCTHGHT